MHKNLLISKLALNGDNLKTLARKLGLSPQRLSAKVNSRRGAEFTQSEMLRIKDEYALKDDELGAIFFT